MSFAHGSHAHPLPENEARGVLVSLSARREAMAATKDALVIDCADCAHRNTSVCGDCVVSFIVDREPEDAVIIDADEARAVRLLEQVGLLPGNRHADTAC